MTRPASTSQVLGSYALLLAALIALWTWVGGPHRDRLADLDGRITELRAGIETLRQDTAQRRRQASRDEAQLARADAILWPAETPAVAATRLQQATSALIEQHGGTVNTSSIFDDTDAGTVSVSLHFSTQIDRLRDLLYALESTPPLVFIDLLAVRVRDPYLMPQAQTAGNRNPVLEVQLNATAHFVVEAK